MRDRGAVILGEASGGGSCSIVPAVLSDGCAFFMSAGIWNFINAAGLSLEGGCPPDLPIALAPDAGADPLAPGAYAPYFSDEALDAMLCAAFAAGADLAA